MTSLERSLIQTACSLQVSPAERLAAATQVLSYLAAGSPDLRQIMIRALHEAAAESPSGQVPEAAACWRYLLGFLATGAWCDALSLLGLAGAGEEAGAATGGSHGPAAAFSAWQDPDHAVYRTVIEAFTAEPPEAPAGAGTAKVHLLRQALRSSGFLAPAPDPRTAQAARRIRVAAACLLGLRGAEDVIPVLEQIIDDSRRPEDLIWKLRAIQALGNIPSERSGPPLLKALASPDRRLHQAARHALFCLGPHAAPTWQEALLHPDQHVRWHAAIGLGQIGDPQGVEILAESLADENAEVRSAAARVLANLDVPPPEGGLSAAVRAVLQVISQRPLTEPLRQAALSALHAMPSAETQRRLQPLINALRTDRLGLSPTAALEAPRLAQALLLQQKESSV